MSVTHEDQAAATQAPVADTDTLRTPPLAVRVSFDTEPGRYRHWRLSVDGPVATLTLDVAEDGGLAGGYELKMNSYDLGVDIELHDAVQRLRFEHPEVRAVVMTSGKDRMFCAGANIRMLAQASHAWKVNFCKFTNETRTGIEDATACSGQAYIAALNGTAAGRRLRAGPGLRRDRADRRRVVGGGAARGAAAGRAAGHRRADPAGGQARRAAGPAPTCSRPRPRASAARRRWPGGWPTRRSRPATSPGVSASAGPRRPPGARRRAAGEPGRRAIG